MNVFMRVSSIRSCLVRSLSFHRLRLSQSYSNSSYIQIMPFYAVAKGVVPGIYTEWSECQKQVQSFRGPQFKKFATREEAEEFISQKVGNVVDKRKKDGEKTEHTLKESAAMVTPAKDKPSKKEKDKVKDVQAAHLPPELLEMQLELRRQQKELSLLRQRFDAYVSAVSAAAASAASTTADSSSNGTAKGKKRAHSPDGSAEESASDTYQSAIKKRVLDRPAPDKDQFEIDADGNVVVYTDGCCEFNGRHGAKAGVGVYFGPDNPLNLSEPVRGRATNNTAEIQAITYALELVKRAGFTKALINTDSQFVINCMTSWLSGWKKRGWKKSDGTPVINKEDLIDLDKAGDGLLVKYNHVKGHSGVDGNEHADQLAKAGSKRYDESVKE